VDFKLTEFFKTARAVLIAEKTFRLAHFISVCGQVETDFGCR